MELKHLDAQESYSNMLQEFSHEAAKQSNGTLSRPLLLAQPILSSII